MKDDKHTEPGPVGSREERGDSRSSRRDPPHVTENAEDAELQEHHVSPDDVPILPANAQGSDKQGTPDEASPEIDDESMYEGRTEEDKEQPPSERAE